MNPSRGMLTGFLDAMLYSYAQILFSNRRWMGAVLLAATFVHPISGLLVFAGVVISNALAHALRFDATRIRSGFYGFNGILLGAAYGYYLDPTPFLLAIFPIFVLVTFFVAAALENYLAVSFNLPGLSLPFVLALFITLIFLRNYDLTVVHVRPLSELAALDNLPGLVQRYLHSMALILFQPGILAGLLIAAGLLLFSRVLFVLSVAGYLTSEAVVSLLLPSAPPIVVTLCGLNAILAAIALGGSLVIPSRKSLVLALLATVMTVVFTGFFMRALEAAQLPVMVLPFNLVVLGTVYSLKFRPSPSGLVLLYFAPGSPEENHYYHHTSQARLSRLAGLAADLPFSGEWSVTQGHDGSETHQGKWRHAWDFAVKGEDGKTYSGSGLRPEEFHCYRLPVLAPLDGEVARVADGIINSTIGGVNLQQNWGNTVVLKHAEGLYSALSHLEAGTLRFKPGDRVRRGDVVALCGSSGRSPEPHLHFQFQATDIIGAPTVAFPLACYFERSAGRSLLQLASTPRAGSEVRNLPPNRVLNAALTFALDGKHDFLCKLGNGHEMRETWDVRVDIYNFQYLESSAGAVAYFQTNGRMFSLTDFRGNRQCALYYFYLTCSQVPLGFEEGACWSDRLPLSKVRTGWVRPVSEFFLLLHQPLTAQIDYCFTGNDPQSPEVRSRLEIRGRGLFASFRRSTGGILRFSDDQGVATFEYRAGDRLICSARKVNDRTE